MHELQFLPEWMDKFSFQKKKVHRNSFSSLYFLIMFQPAKCALDLSQLRRIEPEILPPYREKPEDKRNAVHGNEDESRSGGSTPEIEPYSQSLTKENVDDGLASADDGEDVEPADQQTFGFKLGPKKTMGFVSSQAIKEEEVVEKPNLPKRTPGRDMEIEKMKDEPIEEKDISYGTQRLLNQPLGNIMEDDDASRASRDLKAGKGVNVPTKMENIVEKSPKKNFYLKPRFDDSSVIMDARQSNNRAFPRENSQFRNESYGRPQGQFGQQRRPHDTRYTNALSQKPNNYGNEHEEPEGQTNKKSNFNDFLRSIQDRLTTGNSRQTAGNHPSGSHNFSSSQNVENRPYDPDDAFDDDRSSQHNKPDIRPSYNAPNTQPHSRFPQKSQYLSQSPASTFVKTDRNVTNRLPQDNMPSKDSHGFNRNAPYQQSQYAGRPQIQTQNNLDDEETDLNVNLSKDLSLKTDGSRKLVQEATIVEEIPSNIISHK